MKQIYCCIFTIAIGFLLIQAPVELAAQTAFIKDIATDANDPLNRDDSEPSIAVNPLNPNEITIVAFSESWNSTRGAPTWRSFDGGLTWEKFFQIPQPESGLSGPGDQKVAYDANGLLYVVELGYFPIKNFIYRQSAGPNDPLTPGVVYGDDQPHLSADIFPGSSFVNRLYSPWLNFGYSQPRSMVSHSTTGGALVTNVPVYPPITFPNRTTRIAIAPNGKAYVVYKTRETSPSGGFEGVHFRVNRSDDGGLSWNALGPNGVSVHGASLVQTIFTNTFGNTIKGKVARARSSDAWIAAHPLTGDVYVSYVSKDASDFAQIYVARSTDEGANWSSTRATDETHHCAYPEIAVADNGTIGVLYVDYDDSGNSTIFRHHFARSFNNGISWTGQILQSMDPTPMANARNGFLWGDYEGLTAIGDMFYGVFTGASIGRKESQLDPIFFKETAVKPIIYQYAAKLVCGEQRKSNELRLVKGLYATTINIHNPNSKTVKFFKKLALSYPPGSQEPGKVIPIGYDTLGADMAMETDCMDIQRRLFPNGYPASYIEGFIVIESPMSLDVSAVYTSAKKSGFFFRNTKVTSIDVERVCERKTEDVTPPPQKCPDLIVQNFVPNSLKVDCPGGPGTCVTTVSFTIANVGTGNAGAFNIRIVLDPAASVVVNKAVPGGLAAGATLTFTISTPPGGSCFDSDCTICVTVDSDNTVEECNEGNNKLCKTTVG